ncbi:hypothetical protein [Novosphingopyxis sp.]|uniref:hypothetical protein n=1 Tax=Novosphingopyxis sp. TaxID=2709690 RepID=UPI003B5BDC4E
MTIKLATNETDELREDHIEWLLDPLEMEAFDEEALHVGRRALIRIALVASEVGARFQREGLSQDPLSWMLSPRDMFSGQPPIVACMTLDGCARAVLVHGLGLGLDISMEAIEALMSRGRHIPEAVVANCINSKSVAADAKKPSVMAGPA